MSSQLRYDRQSLVADTRTQPGCTVATGLLACIASLQHTISGMQFRRIFRRLEFNRRGGAFSTEPFVMSQAADRPFDDSLEAAKLRALAEFAAGAGHEINNPLATIIGYAQQLLANETDPDRRHALATIGGQALRIRDMIGDVMLFARPPTPKPIPLDLGAVLLEIVEKFATEIEAAGILLETEISGPVEVFADPVQTRVAASAVIRNALEATSPGGRISCAAYVATELGKGYGVLSVCDSGHGLSDCNREHLFDPFYSGRQAGRGLGFGLSKAWRIVTNHGGRIEVASPAAGGTQFTLYWPAKRIDNLTENPAG